MQGLRIIPLPPCMGQLLAALPRRNEFVFSSPAAASGHRTDPHTTQIIKFVLLSGVDVTLYDLRRSVASLCE